MVKRLILPAISLFIASVSLVYGSQRIIENRRSSAQLDHQQAQQNDPLENVEAKEALSEKNTLK